MNYEDMSKDELIEYIKKLKKNQNGKYGLVWDREKEPEQIVKDCDKYIPVLTEKKELEIKNGGENNILIEGDNFHSLSVLNYTHKEAIDVIYIDPPYNTGKEFIYNDRIINEEDGYRHSKWLNFMEKRITISKNLLKEDGIIFISINDIEFAQLKLLCDSVFSPFNFISIITWQNLDSIKNDAKYFSTNTEYILVYAKDKSLLNIRGNKKGEKQRAYYKNKDNDPRGDYLLTPLHAKSGNEASLYEYTFKNGQIWRAPAGTFPRYSLDTLINLEEDNRILLDPNGKNVPQRKTFLYEVSDRMPPVTFWSASDYGSTRQSNKELSDLIGKGKFQNPKPTKLIKKLIDLVDKDNPVVLDFFAGSGTTGHAVLDLNKEDGGNRKFILCTNNENNICEEITYKRLENVILGKCGKEPLNGTLRYFKTEFVYNNDIETKTKDQLYYDLTEKCIPMLCIKGNTFNKIDADNEYVIFTNEDKTKYSCVYFDIFGLKYDEFIKKIENIDQEKLIYIFTLGDYVDTYALKNVKNYKLEPIPYKIFELYKKIAKMSKEV